MAGLFDLGISMGWACGQLDEETARAADLALLKAKRHGKNRVAQSDGCPDPRAREGMSRARLGWLCDAARLLWRHWPTAALLTDASGRIMAVNPSYEQLTGRAWSDLADQNPNVNAAGDTSPAVYQDLWARVGGGESWQGVLWNRRPDGTLWRARECIVPVRMGQDVLGYWATVAEDDPGEDSLKTN